jgi:putative CocE/NonD family hydrolase
MKNQNNIFSILIIIFLLVFVNVGCERKHNQSSDLKETIEQIQSLNEVAPSDIEDEELGIIVERNVPVPMRDGIILRADVHRPDRGGPYPVLVKRTPYGKEALFDQFVKAGYIVVSQDVRGLGDSEGKYESLWRFNTHDAEDGYDTVEWAAHLRGSNGKVGAFGSSYPAFLVWRMAPLKPPALVAMSAGRIPAHIWDGEKPGTIRPGIRLWWLAALATDMRWHDNSPGVQTDWEQSRLSTEESQKWLYWVPWLDLPQDFFGHETQVLKTWLKDPRDDPWKLDAGCKNITIPNLDVTGWYDYANGDMLLFRTMAKEAKTKVARTASRLIVGPWPHASSGRSYGNIDFGPSAKMDITAVKVRWFDYWIKGKQNGVDQDPPVRIFVMGDNEWRDESHWPLQRAQDKILFIDGAGNANTPAGDGKLVIERPVSADTDTYTYDPADPVPSPFGEQDRIPMDQRSLADRKDILVYQTDVLAERVEVTGNPIVELYASSQAPDTDWFVRLIDVAPDGLARDVSSGMVRARYRNGFEKPELIRPGEVIKYTIRMSPTSNAFLPGHRIRLDITSSDFPNFDRNHNTAANPNADAVLAATQQTIYHGAEYPTRIVLPWIPNPKETQGPQAEKTTEGEDGPQSQQPISSLHRAAVNGDIKEIERLLSAGADINLLDGQKRTPLCLAVEGNKMEAVRFFVDAGADVNAGLWPPLYKAVDANDLTLAEYLIAHGARVDLPLRWTPLQEVPYSSSVKMAELLIDKGADLRAEPWRVWQGSIEEGRMDILELLLQKGMDINSLDEDGTSPLGFTFLADNDDAAKYLFERGADFIFSQKELSGLTALHYAAVAGDQEIAKLSLARGDNVNARDNVYEFIALHYAARFGTENVAEVLIANGADIMAKDKWGYQPIHWAAYHDRPGMIELLIAKGADVNANTSLGQTPLELAKPRRNTATIEVLRKHGARE